MRLTLIALGLAALAAPALAAEPAPVQSAGADDVKVNQLIVYGDEACPPSTDEQITVCARRPESDRFRIPGPLRDNPNATANEPWTNRAEQLEYVGKTGIGSCSVQGPGGGIGCYQQLVRQAKAERANSDETNWNRLIEDARQERLGRIDAASDALEARLKEEGK